MKIPISLLDANNLNQGKLSKYNTLILADGSYSQLDSIDVNSLKDWIANGGTLISVQSASSWVVEDSLTDEHLLENNELDFDIPYDQIRNVSGAQRIGGAIFNVELDNTHPVAYGYGKTHPIFRRGTAFFKLSDAPAANVGRYTSSPLISGYISEEKLDEMKNTASIISKKQDSGRIIMFADNPAFRAFWYGTHGLLMNAILFGKAF
tara:strand:- start:2138 stop:2758 length:621 start_codon:yes stop_codon:yes gene_type:complete